MHEGDWGLVKGDIRLNPLKEGDCFECGGYRLEVLEIPGHTYGSVAFYDRAGKLLLPGDSVQKDGPIFMFGGHRNLDLYIESLRRLKSLEADIETVIPCHHDYPVSPDYIGRNLKDALALKNGELAGRKHEFMPCSSYRGEWTEFLY